jgi:DNA-binding phage protein
MESNPLSSVGPALRLLAERRDLDVSDVAKWAGLTAAHVNQVMKRGSNPTAKTIGKVLAGMEYTVRDLAEALEEIDRGG